MTTNPDLDQARKWAKDPSYQGDVPSVAAAHVIASLPDEWIDADKLRVLLDRWATNPFPTPDEVAVLNDVEALLTPPLPTLADMTDEERQACQWMQADHVEHGRVILTHVGDQYIYYMKPGGLSGGVSPNAGDRITPLPDLPRMVWPDEHHPATDTDMSKSSPEIDMSRPHDDDVDMKPEDVPAGERAMEEQTAVVDRGWIYHGDTERTHLPDGTAVHRFVTDWEVKA